MEEESRGRGAGAGAGGPLVWSQLLGGAPGGAAVEEGKGPILLTREQAGVSGKHKGQDQEPALQLQVGLWLPQAGHG